MRRERCPAINIGGDLLNPPKPADSSAVHAAQNTSPARPEEVIEFKDYLRSGPAFDDLEMDRASESIALVDPFSPPAVSSPPE